MDAEPLFEVVFLEGVFDFLRGLDTKRPEKILYNIRKAQVSRDPELFKKRTDEIWEFRTLFQGLQYRLLAFWDTTATQNTLVISTNGFVKKQSKVPGNEIQKARLLRARYFEDPLKSKKKKK